VSARDRWTAFLQQIADRYKLICEEAAQGAKEALAETGYDPIPIANAWSGIQSRLHDLERKPIDTWNEKVQATYEAEGIPHEVQMADRERGAQLAFDLENSREALQHHIFAEGARAMYARALETQKERLCPSCGGPFDIPLTYRAVNVTCPRCRTVSTFEPGMMVRNVVAFGSHSLSWESAQAEWLAMRQSERRMKAHRSPTPLAALKDYERAQIVYWWKYFTTKGTMEPEMRDTRLEVSSRMEQWYRFSAEHEEQWRAAGRPREAI